MRISVIALIELLEIIKKIVKGSLTILTAIILLTSIEGYSQQINQEHLIGIWYLQKVEEGNDSSKFFNYRDCPSMEFLSKNQMLNNNSMVTTEGTWNLHDNKLDCKNTLNDGTIENMHFNIQYLSNNELIMLDIYNNKLLHFTHKCDRVKE